MAPVFSSNKMSPPTRTSRTARLCGGTALRQIDAYAAVSAAAVLALAACGGGGGGAQTATPQTGGNGTAAGGDRAMILAAAPSLPDGSPPVPSLPYRCGNVAIGAASSGEIEVPAGEVCVLQGTCVDGNIKLGRGSVLEGRPVQRPLTCPPATQLAVPLLA